MISAKLLISNIVESVRAYASRFPTFSDRGGGGVLIVVEPTCSSAGIYFDLSRHEILKAYFAKILPDGSETITIPDENNVKVCTFGFAAMKTSDAFYAIDYGGIQMSGVYPYNHDEAGLDYDCGYAHHLGCVIFRVTDGPEHFCDIFVTTSGGRPREDILSSYAAKEAIEEAFNLPGCAVLAPKLEDVQMAIMYAEDNERAKAEETDLLDWTWNALEDHFQELDDKKRPPVQIGKVNKEVNLMMDEVSWRPGRRWRIAARKWLLRFDSLPRLARF
ncbi:hypothetical protein IKF04_02015 [Candidatus Saccharibacteria bacterium]|nr:hypothetical protein [Candidatus Saccharibacteria bacterium]